MTHVAEFSVDGSIEPLKVDFLDLLAGDSEVRQLLVNGFQTGDTIVSIKLVAKLDISDSDNDVDTIIATGNMTTPARDPNARLVAFSFDSSKTIRLQSGRVYSVRAVVTRSAVTYTKTIALGFIAAAYPGATAVAPSDEAALRADAVARLTKMITDIVLDGVFGKGDYTFPGAVQVDSLHAVKTAVVGNPADVLGSSSSMQVYGILTAIKFQTYSFQAVAVPSGTPTIIGTIPPVIGVNDGAMYISTAHLHGSAAINTATSKIMVGSGATTYASFDFQTAGGSISAISVDGAGNILVTQNTGAPQTIILILTRTY